MVDFSIGDIILCGRITYRLFTAATSGRKNAPRDLRELESALFGLTCSLDYLEQVSRQILSGNINGSGHSAADVRQRLGFTIRSCLQTLKLLEEATEEYRKAASPSLVLHHKSPSDSLSQTWPMQARVQWRLFMWHLKGESLTKYRPKLEAHTSTINLILGTLIWYVFLIYLVGLVRNPCSRSATDRIEQHSMHQGQQIEELALEGRMMRGAMLYQTSRFYSAMLPSPGLNAPSTRHTWHPSHRILPSLPSPHRLRYRPKCDRAENVCSIGSQPGHAILSSG